MSSKDTRRPLAMGHCSIVLCNDTDIYYYYIIIIHCIILVDTCLSPILGAMPINLRSKYSLVPILQCPMAKGYLVSLLYMSVFCNG